MDLKAVAVVVVMAMVLAMVLVWTFVVYRNSVYQ